MTRIKSRSHRARSIKRRKRKSTKSTKRIQSTSTQSTSTQSTSTRKQELDTNFASRSARVFVPIKKTVEKAIPLLCKTKTSKTNLMLKRAKYVGYVFNPKTKEIRALAVISDHPKTKTLHIDLLCAKTQRDKKFTLDYLKSARLTL